MCSPCSTEPSTFCCPLLHRFEDGPKSLCSRRVCASEGRARTQLPCFCFECISSAKSRQLGRPKSRFRKVRKAAEPAPAPWFRVLLKPTSLCLMRQVNNDSSGAQSTFESQPRASAADCPSGAAVCRPWSRTCMKLHDGWDIGSLNPRP